MGTAANTYRTGSSDQRPWGSWQVVDAGAGFVVKRIETDPGAKLSLQLHRGRDEHWVVVGAAAGVTRGTERLRVSANDSVSITRQTAHRIEKIGTDLLVFVEVQVGPLLDEADIVRLEDSYGRV